MRAPAPRAPVLSVSDLTVSVVTETGPRPLVSGLSFDLFAGETLCIAGESSSGKSISSLAAMGLLPPGVRATGGSIRLDGQDLTRLPERRMQAIRGARIAMIFQELMTSLNPVLTIGTQLSEAIRSQSRRRCPGAGAGTEAAGADRGRADDRARCDRAA